MWIIISVQYYVHENLEDDKLLQSNENVMPKSITSQQPFSTCNLLNYHYM